MSSTRRSFLQNVAATAAGTALLAHAHAAEPAAGWVSAFPADADRVWVGPDLWANRLQDWRVVKGRLECVRGGPAFAMRAVHLLTRRVGKGAGDVKLSVKLERLDGKATDAAAGFLLGAGGDSMDYRAAALVHHSPGPGGGLFLGIDGAGKLVFRDWTRPAQPEVLAAGSGGLPAEVLLTLEATPADGKQRILLTASDARTGKELARAEKMNLAPARLTGSVALVSHPGTGGQTSRFGFREWRVAGSRIEAYPDRTCGPILSTMYTVQNGVLKLGAQLLPVGEKDGRTAELQTADGDTWKTVATAPVVVPGFTAHFRVENWVTARDVRYRVAYPSGSEKPDTWDGVIKRDPAEKDTIVLAALSCVQQVDGRVDGPQQQRYPWSERVWYPHADMVPRVAWHKPDLYFFAGDQIYEGNPTRVVRKPEDEAELDYLYKWYLWCWSYRDLIRDTPTITIPDDHDVYQGNVWGNSGRPSMPEDPAGLQGGYGMPAAWLNMMQRTQCGHLPDPFDPTPAAQDISVYYTALTVGGVGFAILEDRKFKSAPSIVTAQKTLDSHIIEKDYDTRKADLPGATLLGERQLRFLEAFTADWRGQEMKAALSQTIFCNLQISSRGSTKGELDKDLDSNGWPQTGRNMALHALRKGFLVHVAGDQHLASLIHMGTDAFEDSVWSLCVPAVANLYTRFWNPDYPPLKAEPGLRPFMGRYEDGFHNKITVFAVANPVEQPKPGQFPDPVDLYRKGTGYGIVRFHKKERTVTFEVWPRHVDPANGKQYEGWPRTVKQLDNYSRQPAGFLPTVMVTKSDNPVVQVIEDATGEVVYTLRIRGKEFQPMVFTDGPHTVKVGELGSDRVRTWKGVKPLSPGEQRTLSADL